MRLIAGFLILCVSASAVCTAPTGATTLTSINAGGDAANSATWGGSAIGTGDGKYLIATGPVSIHSMGTSAGTGVLGFCAIAGTTSTSTTSITIANGSTTFTTQSGLVFPTGTRARATSAASALNYLEGAVTSYSGSTLVVNVDTIGGNNTTHADWSITSFGTSATSNTITVASKTFTTQAGLPFVVGARAKATVSAGNAGFYYVEGPVTSYSGTTLVINADTAAGIGSGTNWNITGFGSSTTSLPVAAGSTTFVTQSGLPYVAGMRVRAVSRAIIAYYLEGAVTSYSGTTMVVNVDIAVGTGTHADWDLNGLATSTTSVTIGNGVTTLTVGAGLALTVGGRLQAASNAGATNYLLGQITSYSGTTLVVNVDTIGGSGTHNDWNLTQYGSFVADNSAPVTIYIGSTGTDPCGSGPDYQPAATATMHGFFNPVGNLTLVGTQANPVTIKPADWVSPASPGHPWYINQPGQGIVSGLTITVKWADLYNLGAPIGSFCSGGSNYDPNKPYYGGISYWSSIDGGLDIENTRVTGYYYIFSSDDSTSNPNIAFVGKNNVSTGRAGNLPADAYAYGSYNYGLGSVVVQNLVDYSPGAAGALEGWHTVSDGSYTNLGGNAVMGTASFAVCGHCIGIGNYDQDIPRPTPSIPSYLVWNDPTQAGYATIFSTSFVVAPQGPPWVSWSNINLNYVYAENSNYLSNYPGTASNLVSITNFRSSAGIFASYASNPLPTTVTNSLFLLYGPLTTQNPSCIFGSGTGATVIATNNTCDQLVPSASIYSNAMQFGLSSATVMVNNKINNNLIVGYDAGIADSSSTGDQFVATGTGGVGVYANATYNVATSYVKAAAPVNFDNGVTLHPNAVYGDVNGIDPSFLDTTRITLASYDARVLQGPGTALDWFQNYGAFVSGWGSNSRTFSSTPIVDIVNWVKAGFKPGNAALCGIGAAPCVTAATAIIPTP